MQIAMVTPIICPDCCPVDFWMWTQHDRLIRRHQSNLKELRKFTGSSYLSSSSVLRLLKIWVYSFPNHESRELIDERGLRSNTFASEIRLRAGVLGDGSMARTSQNYQFWSLAQPFKAKPYIRQKTMLYCWLAYRLVRFLPCRTSRKRSVRLAGKVVLPWMRWSYDYGYLGANLPHLAASISELVASSGTCMYLAVETQGSRCGLKDDDQVTQSQTSLHQDEVNFETLDFIVSQLDQTGLLILSLTMQIWPFARGTRTLPADVCYRLEILEPQG